MLSEMNQRRYLALLSDAVREHRSHLLRAARAEGLSAEDALDVVQRAFELLLETEAPDELLAAPGEARRYLATITRNLARNHRRLHAVARPHEAGDLESLPDEAPSPETAALDAEALVRLGFCLQTLAATQRAVVRLRLLEERPGDDVAAALGLTSGNVAVLLHRARASLRLCMDSAAPV